MQEQLEKDIEFCRKRRSAHRNVFFKGYEKLEKIYLGTLVLPIWSSMIACIISIGKFTTVPRSMLGCIMISYGVSTTISALYMKPDNVARVYQNRDAWYHYGNLKARYEKLDANKGFMEDRMIEQNYQKCHKKKVRLATRYPNPLLDE